MSDDADTADPSDETSADLHTNDPSSGARENHDRASIPPSIELAWGLRDRGTRGPKPGLTLERVVAAGIEVALTDGLAGVSMARIASELGVGTMSLYRYVAAKDELLTLMVDTALAAPPSAEHPDADWRAGLTRWAVGVRDAYRRHPWSLRVPISAPPLGPNNVAWLEAALRALASTPLSEQQKLSCILLVSGFVRNDATLTADFATGAGSAGARGGGADAGAGSAGARGGGADAVPGYGAVLSRLIDAATFPALDRAISSGALDDEDDIDAEFNFGLARILDGIETLIDASNPPGGVSTTRREA